MAFLRRPSALLRSGLFSRLCQHGPLKQPEVQPPHSFLLARFSPMFGARFMCSVPSTKLFVGGLAWSMDENSLREAFVKYGEVVEAKIVLDRETGRSKGFGFVSFTCVSDAEAAMKATDGTVFSGRPLRVNFAVEKQRGFGSFGGGGGGSYGSSGGFDAGSTSSSFTDNSFSSSSGSSSAGDSFFGDNSFSEDTFGNPNATKESSSSGQQSNFFDDSAFDDLDSDHDFAEGSR